MATRRKTFDREQEANRLASDVEVAEAVFRATDGHDHADATQALSRPDLGGPGGVMSLQSAAGNRAVDTLVQTKLTVGKADDPYEREADAVADRVVQSLSSAPADPEHTRRSTGRIRRATSAKSPDATIGPEGGALDAETEKTLERSRGSGQALDSKLRPSLESSLGADLGSVRVHTDGTADQLSRGMQATAFTTGSDIYFRSGAYDPGSTDGQKLIAHEATHVVQQGGARRKIDRKLAPATPYIFESMAEKSGDGKKITIRKPRYFKVRDSLREYVEKGEGKNDKWRAKKLKSILDHIESWLADDKNASGASDVVDARREAFNWLAPKIAAEFVTAETIKSKSSGGAKETDKGGMNEVEVGIKTKKDIGTSKSNTGVFKSPSKGYEAWDAPAALDSGIDKKDAKFTERAIAGTAVAKLMGTDVVAESIKADRDGKKGYMMEQATGVQPKGEKKIRPSNPEETAAWKQKVEGFDPNYDEDEKGPYKKQDVVNPIDWKDPVLQEKLVELQLFDTITGQVDRHASNYFIDQKAGKETKVKGIDPDLAFGKDKNVEQMKQFSGVNDKSVEELPPIVARSTFDRIMAMNESDVQNILGPLLSPDEVRMAIVRLQRVKVHLKDLESAGLVYKSFTEEDENFRLNRFTEKNSYIGRDRYWQARAYFEQKKQVV